MHDGWMWGMGWFGWLFWILVIVLLVWAVARWRAPRGGRAPEGPEAPRETPLETLERRYAEGALSTEEYEERRARLRDGA